MNDNNSNKLNEPLKIRVNLPNTGSVLHEFAYPDDNVLNPAIEDYIEKQVKHLTRKRNLEIEVSAKDEVLPVFKKALDSTFRKKIGNATKEIKKKRILAFVMLLVGALFLGVGFLLNEQKLFFEIFLVASWVFLWRAVELLFFEIQSTLLSVYKYVKILKADISSNNTSSKT